VYFTIGVPTESGNILPNIQNVEIVSLEALVGEVYPDRTFSDGGRDPHIWLSITRVKEIVKIIRDKLQEIDPANAETYQSNAETFTSQLTDTDNTIRNIFSDVTMNTFIVYHPAFGYFADEYGLNMVAIEEEGKEATAIELQSIIDLARDDQIEYIFKQPEIDSSQVQSIADEINAEIITLNPLSADYCNNLISIANAIRDALR
jgi:zinc transport system substrate-binding protein